MTYFTTYAEKRLADYREEKGRGLPTRKPKNCPGRWFVSASLGLNDSDYPNFPTGYVDDVRWIEIESDRGVYYRAVDLGWIYSSAAPGNWPPHWRLERWNDKKKEYELLCSEGWGANFVSVLWDIEHDDPDEPPRFDADYRKPLQLPEQGRMT